MVFNVSLSLSNASIVPSGSLSKASSVGANTVKGPSPCKASTSPVSVSALASVLKFPDSTAIVTMSLSEPFFS